jgi:hypothetical protein
VFILPALPDGGTAQVVFGDGLGPDKSVPVTKIAGTKLFLRGADGRDVPLALEQADNAYVVKLKGTGPRVVHGQTAYGVVQKPGTKKFLLHYHPKAVLGDPFAAAATLGKDRPVEVVPVREAGRLRFRVLAEGRPLAGAEVFLRKPGAEALETLTSDDQGLTPALDGPGRYLVVARRVDAKSGEHAGQAYEEVRHYATLVIDYAGAK